MGKVQMDRRAGREEQKEQKDERGDLRRLPAVTTGRMAIKGENSSKEGTVSEEECT